MHFFTFIKIFLLLTEEKIKLQEKLNRKWNKAKKESTAIIQLLQCAHEYAERVKLDLIDALVSIFPRMKYVHRAVDAFFTFLLIAKSTQLYI